mgnify:CR=1 FL=1
MEVIAESTRSKVGIVDGYWVLDLFPRWRNSALMESVEIRMPIRNKMGNGGGGDDGGTGVRVSLFFCFLLWRKRGTGGYLNTRLYFFKR